MSKTLFRWYKQHWIARKKQMVDPAASNSDANGVARGLGLGPGGTSLIKIKFWKEFKISNSSLLLLNKVLNGLSLFIYCV